MRRIDHAQSADRRVARIVYRPACLRGISSVDQVLDGSNLRQPFADLCSARNAAFSKIDPPNHYADDFYFAPRDATYALEFEVQEVSIPHPYLAESVDVVILQRSLGAVYAYVFYRSHEIQVSPTGRAMMKFAREPFWLQPFLLLDDQFDRDSI